MIYIFDDEHMDDPEFLKRHRLSNVLQQLTELDKEISQVKSKITYFESAQRTQHLDDGIVQKHLLESQLRLDELVKSKHQWGQIKNFQIKHYMELNEPITISYTTRRGYYQ